MYNGDTSQRWCQQRNHLLSDVEWNKIIGMCFYQADVLPGGPPQRNKRVRRLRRHINDTSCVQVREGTRENK